jgi:hypothetical protein
MMSVVLANITDGMANITMNDVTSMAHTYSGTRLSVMPGARSLKTVVTRMIDDSSPDASVKVIICAHMSTRLPGE